VPLFVALHRIKHAIGILQAAAHASKVASYPGGELAAPIVSIVSECHQTESGPMSSSVTAFAKSWNVSAHRKKHGPPAGFPLGTW
jgi:hypothetical protein